MSGSDRLSLTAILTATGSEPPALSTTKSRIYFVGRFAHEFRDNMGVSVHRKVYITVTKNLHHSSGMNTLRKQERRRKVPRIVDPYRSRQTGMFQNPLELRVNSPWFNRRSLSGWKHETKILPFRATQ